MRAFESLSVSGPQLPLLRSLAAAPRCSAKMRALTNAALGTDNPKSANLVYGNLARLCVDLALRLLDRPGRKAQIHRASRQVAQSQPRAD